MLLLNNHALQVIIDNALEDASAGREAAAQAAVDAAHQQVGVRVSEPCYASIVLVLEWMGLNHAESFSDKTDMSVLHSPPAC